ncbi:MAG: 1-acyl-sn-glycerol-3-phosphate acyltransferase [Acidobacteriota bacterium]|nr:1-acyl-sn-glycerol-3-phosphate acyltransferase [Acidobacteriota bacterium]
MTRRIITAVLRFALRIFFRRIEVAGLERVPDGGALIFVLNHPNGLVDPAFLLCHAPRPVSFLAKSTLFKAPILGFFVRALDAIPVYRKQDAGEDTSRNHETFARAHQLLTSGGTIAVCPEGVSHSEPSLRPLKSGAARIALGAASTNTKSGAALNLQIVPAGLYYTAKTSFRSAALLYFGDPISVAPIALDADGEPPREAVRELSDRIANALREATLNADHHEALQTVARAERIFSSADDAPEEERSLAQELSLRRRFVEGYAFHRTQSPERLAALDARIRRYEEELQQAGLDAHDFSPATVEKHSGVGHLVTRGLLFLTLALPALAGALVHYPAYRLAGLFATKFSRNYDDVVSTIKVISALLLFPLTWLAPSTLAFFFVGWKTALAVFLFAPLAGFVAVRFSEEFDRFIAGTRAVQFFVTERRFFRQLLTERRAIRREILTLGDEAARAGALETLFDSNTVRKRI